MVWYNDRKAVIIPAHTGFCVYRRRPGANGTGMSGGHAIMTAGYSVIAAAVKIPWEKRRECHDLYWGNYRKNKTASV